MHDVELEVKSRLSENARLNNKGVFYLSRSAYALVNKFGRTLTLSHAYNRINLSNVSVNEIEKTFYVNDSK